MGADVPFGHPDFDRTFPCPHPCHNAERVARMAQVSGLLPEEADLRLEHFETGNQETKEILAAVVDFLKNPVSLFYLWGGSGNGKSLVLKALVNEFNVIGRMAIYVKFTRLLWWMRDSFRDKTAEERESYTFRYERMKGVDVLAIDEFDKASLTDFAQEFRFDFLDDRYERGLHGYCCTIIASNTPPGELPTYLKSRFEDGRCLVVENKAGDLRPYL